MVYPEVGGEFVAAMEDVLALYAKPYDGGYPTVCLDEKPVVLHARRARQPCRGSPGRHVERRDYEYERHGTANLFVLVEPLAGWRHVDVTAQRTKQDYAECLRYLVEERYPQAPSASAWCKTTSTPTPPARSTRRSRPSKPAHPVPLGVPLHAQARQLAQPSRDRDQHLRARLPLASRG